MTGFTCVTPGIKTAHAHRGAPSVNMYQALATLLLVGAKDPFPEVHRSGALLVSQLEPRLQSQTVQLLSGCAAFRNMSSKAPAGKSEGHAAGAVNPRNNLMYRWLDAFPETNSKRDKPGATIPLGLALQSRNTAWRKERAGWREVAGGVLAGAAGCTKHAQIPTCVEAHPGYYPTNRITAQSNNTVATTLLLWES